MGINILNQMDKSLFNSSNMNALETYPQVKPLDAAIKFFLYPIQSYLIFLLDSLLLLPTYSFDQQHPIANNFIRDHISHRISKHISHRISKLDTASRSDTEEPRSLECASWGLRVSVQRLA